MSLGLGGVIVVLFFVWVLCLVVAPFLWYWRNNWRDYEHRKNRLVPEYVFHHALYLAFCILTIPFMVFSVGWKFYYDTLHKSDGEAETLWFQVVFVVPLAMWLLCIVGVIADFVRSYRFSVIGIIIAIFGSSATFMIAFFNHKLHSRVTHYWQVMEVCLVVFSVTLLSFGIFSIYRLKSLNRHVSADAATFVREFTTY